MQQHIPKNAAEGGITGLMLVGGKTARKFNEILTSLQGEEEVAGIGKLSWECHAYWEKKEVGLPCLASHPLPRSFSSSPELCYLGSRNGEV